MVLARLICFIHSESNQHLASAELEHGFDMPKSHIPIIPFYQELRLGTPRSPLQERLGDESYRAGSLDCAALKGLYLTP